MEKEFEKIMLQLGITAAFGIAAAVMLDDIPGIELHLWKVVAAGALMYVAGIIVSQVTD